MNHKSIKLVLAPEDNQRLANLCGQYDEHLKQIEREFNVHIHHRGYIFHISGDENDIKKTSKVLKHIYHETENESDLTPAQIHRLMLNKDKSSDTSQRYTMKMKNGFIKPSSSNQEKYLKAIAHHDINFAIGPAGTGKTYLAVACAVDALEKQQVQRIVLVRPAVEAGEKLGFLPGDLAQKVNPYLRPLYDALYEMMGFERVAKFIENDTIEIAPLAYMRGRTLNDAFIIMDEGQNTTPEQMKMFLTRIGFGSKVVVTGDITQIDLPRTYDSGLIEAIHLFEKIKGISFTYFETKDVVRHPLVKLIISAYESRNKSSDG